MKFLSYNQNNSRRKLAWILCAVISINYLIFHRWSGERWKTIISSDAFGYYTYLPSLFIYHDFEYKYAEEVQKKYHPISLHPLYFTHQHNGISVNKYYIGTTLCMIPFFIAGDLLTQITNQSRDGFSKYYQLAISLGGLIYTLFGLWLFGKVLKKMGVSERASSFWMVSMFLGTNLFYYSTEENALSHAYTSFFVPLFLLSLLKFKEKNSLINFSLIVLSLSMIIIIRPVNVIILSSIPFIIGSLSNTKQLIFNLFKRPIWILGGILFFLILLALQSVIYYIQCEKWWIYAYNEEKFNFLKPHFIETLFSFERGLFIWVPLLILSPVSILILWIKNYKFQSITYLLFGFILIYVLSSWWNWYYGGGFGLRPYVDYYSVIFTGIAVSFSKVKNRVLNIILGSFVLVCIFLNQFQQQQYVMGIIPYMGTSREGYFQVFLRTAPQFRYMMNPDKKEVHMPDSVIEIARIFYDFEKNLDESDVEKKGITNEVSYSGNYSNKIQSPHLPFSQSIKIDENYKGNKKLIIDVKAMIWQPSNKHAAISVLSVKDSTGIQKEWQKNYIIHSVKKKKSWVFYKTIYELKESGKGDEITVYFYQPGGESIYIDDFSVIVYGENN